MVFVPKWEKYRERKPTREVELNLEHSLSQAISHCYITTYDGRFVNLVNNNVADKPTNVQYNNDGLDFSQNYIETSHPIFYDGNDFTFLFSAKRTGATDGGGIFSDTLPANWGVSGFSANFKSTGLLCYAGNTIVNHKTLANFGVGDIVSSGSVGEVGKELTIVQDGEFVETGYYARGVLASTQASPYNAAIGTYYDRSSSLVMRGTLYYLYFYNRALSKLETASLYENPYQILKPRRKWFVLGAGAGGGTSISATTDSLTISEKSAGVNAQHAVNATTQALSLTEYNATVSAAKNINATSDVLNISTNPATVNASHRINVVTQALTINENSAVVVINAGTQINASKQALTIAGQSATVNASKSIAATMQPLAITEYAASVGIGSKIAATSQALTINEQQATVKANKSISAATQALTITEHNATLSTSQKIAATTDSIVITDYAATVKVNRNIEVSTDAITLTDFNAAVIAAKALNATTQSLNITEFNATIQSANAALLLHNDTIYVKSGYNTLLAKSGNSTLLQKTKH
jgi:hypothetical protein